MEISSEATEASQGGDVVQPEKHVYEKPVSGQRIIGRQSRQQPEAIVDYTDKEARDKRIAAAISESTRRLRGQEFVGPVYGRDGKRIDPYAPQKTTGNSLGVTATGVTLPTQDDAESKPLDITDSDDPIDPKVVEQRPSVPIRNSNQRKKLAKDDPNQPGLNFGRTWQA